MMQEIGSVHQGLSGDSFPPAERLRQITSTLLREGSSYAEIREAALALLEFFTNYTGFNPDERENQEHISTSAGRAVSPYGAAFCIVDMIRTRKFMLGLKAAIEARRIAQPNRPVRVLYAGTGPFATLLLPLTCFFRPDELQMVLLDINPRSLFYLKKLLQQLELGAYVAAIEEADALTYRIPDALQPDILLSETMKAALLDEPQLMVCAALLKQCTSDPLLIPASITVACCLAGNLMNPAHELLNLGALLNLNKDFALAATTETSKPEILVGPVWIQVPATNERFNRLVLTTSITVFEQHVIGLNESGLTMPVTVCPIDKSINTPTQIGFRYVVASEPYFENLRQ